MTLTGGIVVAAFVSSTAGAATRAGTVDASFGRSGMVVTQIRDNTYNQGADAVIVQPDGRIVVGGFAFGNGSGETFVVARYLPDGRRDATFGVRGIVTTAFDGGRGFAYITGLALQRDGRILATGHLTNSVGDTQIAVARYNRDGTLDRTFGQQGRVVTPGGRGAEARAIAIGAAGTFYVAGSQVRSTRYGRNWFLLLRYLPNGQLDPTFGDGGRVKVAIGKSAEAGSIAVQPDLKVVLAGRSVDSRDHRDFTLARFTPTGSLDTAFGRAGIVRTSFGSSHSAEATQVIVLPDKRIAATGTTDGRLTDNYPAALVLVRYLPDGRPDPAFSRDGRVRLVRAGANGAGLLALPDGRLIVGGQNANDGTRPRFVAATFTRNGVLDPSFGTRGIAYQADTKSEHVNVTAFDLQPHRGLIGAGYGFAGARHGIGLIRLAI